MTHPNQNPEQVARDLIDEQLRAAGWAVQDKGEWNHTEGLGQAVREYQTDSGLARLTRIHRRTLLIPIPRPMRDTDNEKSV